jgi:hypothetical protein
MRTLIATYRGAERERSAASPRSGRQNGRARAEADEADHCQECLTSGDAYEPTIFRIDPV